MCGICLWLRPDGGVDPNLLAQAANLLRHRGPDAQCLALWRTLEDTTPVLSGASHPPAEARFRLGLAHTRLSILDLSQGSRQPMFSDDGRYALIFNGEIYNYLEKRSALEAQGERFRTSGDTEVLLRSLIREGAAALAGLNGMWAFCFVDFTRRTCLLGRDRYGKKPLFYHLGKNGFMAASEPKAVFRLMGDPPRTLRPDFLSAFLALKWYPGYDPAATPYTELKAVPAGTVLELRLDDLSLRQVGMLSLESLREECPDPDKLSEDIASAVALRLRSDVPVGVLVSGGVDSTAIAAHAAHTGAGLRFYTAKLLNRNGLPKKDMKYARMLARSLGIELREIDLPESDDVLAEFRLLTRQLEAPLNPGLVTGPGYRVYKAMADDGIKVALDGTGGDEVMGGYPQYLLFLLIHVVNQRRVAPALRAALAASAHYDADQVSRLLRLARTVKNLALGRRLLLPHDQRIQEAARYFRPDWRQGLFALQARLGHHQARTLADLQAHALTQGIMPYYLYVADQVSMANSLELRCPFLDYRLAKYLDLPDSLKFKARMNKYLLRRSLPAAVPDAVRWRGDKEGFESSWPDFYARNQGFVTQTVMDSHLCREMLDLDALQQDLAAQSGSLTRPWLRELFTGIFHIGLLEAEYPCRL